MSETLDTSNRTFGVAGDERASITLTFRVPVTSIELKPYPRGDCG